MCRVFLLTTENKTTERVVRDPRMYKIPEALSIKKLRGKIKKYIYRFIQELAAQRRRGSRPARQAGKVLSAVEQQLASEEVERARQSLTAAGEAVEEASSAAKGPMTGATRL